METDLAALRSGCRIGLVYARNYSRLADFNISNGNDTATLPTVLLAYEVPNSYSIRLVLIQLETSRARLAPLFLGHLFAKPFLVLKNRNRATESPS